MNELNHVDQILPPKHRPYYIYTPPYIRTSAGVKVLHLLAHSLNQKNYPAYVLPQFLLKGLPPTHPELKTPLLTQEIIDLHYHEGRTPIIIYPEITHGNPLKAKCVARYILNFPGLLGGSKEFDESELLTYFSKDLMPKHPSLESLILFIPPSDPRIFTPPKVDSKRDKRIFYAKKFKKYQLGVLPEFTKECIEITMGEKNSQTLPEIIELFQTAKVFYAFENTALAAEALLCGCPVVLMSNPKLENVIAKTELGTKGIITSDSEEEILRAQKETALYRSNYLRQFKNFSDGLDKFIAATQERASKIEYKKKIKYKNPTYKSNKINAGFKALILLAKSEKLKVLSTIFNLLGRKEAREKELSKLKKIYISHR